MEPGVDETFFLYYPRGFQLFPDGKEAFVFHVNIGSVPNPSPPECKGV